MKARPSMTTPLESSASLIVPLIIASSTLVSLLGLIPSLGPTIVTLLTGIVRFSA